MNIQNIPYIFNKQKSFFQSNNTLSWEFRAKQLKLLKKMIITYKNQLLDALEKDLGKKEFEAVGTEILPVLEDINNTLKHGKKWIKSKKVSRELLTIDGQGYTKSVPYGVVLVISPWNYPIQLSLMPIIGAIAAGNCMILKPSEYTPNVSEVLQKAVTEFFNPDYFTVICGDYESTKEISECNFDKIFFTGSPEIGKKIMENASKTLTPVTLELGGKSPCIIDTMPLPSLKKSLKRILWGKFINSGQTCIAPDYLIVHESMEEQVIHSLHTAILPYLEERTSHRIVNQRHFKRLESFLKDGKVILGGTVNEAELSIEMTVLKPDSINTPVMKEEIFGPILPLITYSNEEDLISQIHTICENPLAFYIFSENQKFIDHVLNSVSFGGGCINDTISHILIHQLPFGGFKTSGIGAYHGKFSFDVFSHTRSIFKKGFFFDLPFRYPPYKNSLSLVRSLFFWRKF